MTVFGRDASNFDGTISYAGLGYFTHKATEGTTVTHSRFAERLNGARAAGVVGLGSYHVVRTPGNAGNGSLTAQLTYWLTYLDQHTPWWRTYPYWMMQVDTEKWPYDAVSAQTVKDFAALLARAGVPGYKVTYASRGQYGDTLSGIVTDLWNANYSGGPNYPGDSWTPGWAPYSGKTPAFLQYTSTGYDHNAFRGTLDQLRALLSGAPTPPPLQEDDVAFTPDQTAALELVTEMAWRVEALFKDLPATRGGNFVGKDLGVNENHNVLAGIRADLDAVKAAVAALSAVKPEPGVLTDADLLAVQASAQAGARAGINGTSAVFRTPE